jgi:hypothetical protein
MSRHHLHVFFAMDAGPLEPYYALFEALLAARSPALARALAGSGVAAEMYLFGWLQTVFLKALPLASAAAVWDVFLLDGTPALFRAALAILDGLAPAIARGEGMEDTIALLTANAGAGTPAVRAAWAAVAGDAAAFAAAIDAVVLPNDALLELEGLAADPFFYRRILL